MWPLMRRIQSNETYNWHASLFNHKHYLLEGITKSVMSLNNPDGRLTKEPVMNKKSLNQFLCNKSIFRQSGNVRTESCVTVSLGQSKQPYYPFRRHHFSESAPLSIG